MNNDDSPNAKQPPNSERMRRWRIILGEAAEAETGVSLAAADIALDDALRFLYGDEADERRAAGGERSSPHVVRWLGDIRRRFPASVVRVMQKDALERLNLRRMLLEPETLEAVEPDIHLVATLLALNCVMPNETRETARRVVRKVVEETCQRLARHMRQSVLGGLRRGARNRRPRPHEIDWNRTIRANLKHYQASCHTVIPERRIGRERRRSALQDIILCVDQSGSMATSVAYAGIFASALASLPAVSTRLAVYDTAVVDLSERLSDPVEVLFGAQLGGGNDTPRALDYCRTLISRPQETILILMSDLYEGANSVAMCQRMARFVADGVRCVTLLALSDEGAPSYDHENAAQFVRLGVPTFACTPDMFPDFIEAALAGDDIAAWAAARGVGLASNA
jgi:hypothetical protein